MMSERIGRRFVSVVCAAPALALLAGCMTPDPRRHDQSPRASDLVKNIDPTGTVNRNEALEVAAQKFYEQANDLDVEGINATIAELNTLSTDIRTRVAAIPESMGTEVAQSVADADLKSVTARWKEAADEAHNKLAELDPKAVNAAVMEMRTVIGDIAERVEQLDIAAANSVIVEANQLNDRAEETVVETTALVKDLRQAIANLPLQEAAAGFSQIEIAGAAIASTLDLITRALWVALAGLALIAVWALIWIRHTVRNPENGLSTSDVSQPLPAPQASS